MPASDAPGAPRLLVNGTIHSTSEPYAEAAVVEDGVVAWVGSDETAEVMRDERFSLVDLDRALVAPAFVGWVGRRLSPEISSEVAEALDAAAATGYGAVRLSLELEVGTLGDQDLSGLRNLLTEACRVAYAHPVSVYPVVRLEGLQLADAALPENSAALVALMKMLSDLDDVAGTSLALEVPIAALRKDAPETSELSAAELSHALSSISAFAAGAQRQLILDLENSVTGPVLPAEQWVELLATAKDHLRETGAVPAPQRPTVVVGFDTDERGLWERLLNLGLHIVFRSSGHLATALSVGVSVSAAPPEGQNPWALVAGHVHHPEGGVSVRAAFNAQVRAAYRALDGQNMTAGQLNPGSVATYAVWEAESLAVQTPDSRTAAWSTDVRARTPLLPYLDPADTAGERLPRLRATVVKGTELLPAGTV